MNSASWRTAEHDVSPRVHRAFHVGAWCELRQGFRSFRVDRIQTLNVLNSSFPDEPGKRLEDYLSGAGERPAGQTKDRRAKL